MKLSIAWIFDHIEADWRLLDIADIVGRCNKATAEIERPHTVTLDLDTLFAVCIIRHEGHTTMVSLDTTEIALSVRADLQPGQWTLIRKTSAGYIWASYQDAGGSRDAYLPALAIDDAKSWRRAVEHDRVERHDVILEIDNKSITNRPDLWGHRGFAREIAALFQLRMRPLEVLGLHPAHVIQDTARIDASKELPWSFNLSGKTGTSRVAIAHIPSIVCGPSSLELAFRLARVDQRLINSIVDVTNYVMCDIGHPMHAFDAEKISAKNITVRSAHAQEKIVTLDGVTRTLAAEDTVISDGKNPISLAGIMGGLDTSVTRDTTNVLIEAGCFDATSIRRTADRLKLRTEASARFEKSLDPELVAIALRRFYYLVGFFAQFRLHSADRPLTILMVGTPSKSHTIALEHSFIESRLGISIASTQVISLLAGLEFEVTHHKGIYTVVVPSFRATKDITIAEDVIEEIGRLYGYEKIQPQLPMMRLEPKNSTERSRLRTIKHCLAYEHAMHELYSYALYDESLLRTIGYMPEHTLRVQDPVSDNWQQLVTSLIPNMAKAVMHNIPDRDTVRVFEWGRVWQNLGAVTERKCLAGMIFQKHANVDFYDVKHIVTEILSIVGEPVVWKQIEKPHDPWYEPYKTAHLICHGTIIGHVGMMRTSFASHLGEGSGWLFELDGDWVLSAKFHSPKYVPIAKFPGMVRDVSVLIGYGQTIDVLKQEMYAIDPRIVLVTLVDFFEKKEWENQRSISLRYVVRDDAKTLTKHEVDQMSLAIEQMLKSYGGTIR